ncbi:MAG: hypothetical protein WCP20_19210 [Desulfuromonadales bacterium]
MVKKNMDDVKRLLEIGKEKGFLTFDEVNYIHTPIIATERVDGYGVTQEAAALSGTNFCIQNPAGSAVEKNLHLPTTGFNVALVSWDLIPQESILERTPREFFKLSATHESQFVSWLETLPVEMLFENSPPNRHALESLDLLAVSSCSIAWLLSHCGVELLKSLFDELFRIIGECLALEPNCRDELLSQTPFVDEQLLFYLLDRFPPCTNALIMILLKECNNNELLTTVTESSVCARKGFSAATMLELAQFYTLSREYQKLSLELFKTSIHPDDFNSSSECLTTWINRHLTKNESQTVLLYTGWAGTAMNSGDISKLLCCSRQNVYNHLNKSDEKLSIKSAVMELQELTFGIFSEVWRAGGICATEELILALTTRFGWHDRLCEEGLSKILERSKTKVVVIKNGWAIISNRSCLSETATSKEHWTLYDNEISPAALILATTVVTPESAQEPEASPCTGNDSEPDELTLPEPGEEFILLPEWLDSDDFVWRAAGALLVRSERLNLHTSGNPWSIAELRFPFQDYETLRKWGGTGTFISRKLDTRKRAGIATFSGREALALLFIVYAAEIARRDANEGELWPAVYKSLGSGIKDLLMMSQGYDNASPRPWLKTEMERTFRGYNLRHAFDSAGTHAYIRSISLQFGFTMNGLQRLPWWLCGQQIPVAVEELAGNGANRSSSFIQLWQTFKEFRWKGIPLEEFRRKLCENPWLPSSGVDAVSRAVTSKINLLQQGEDADSMGISTSASILGEPRLALVGGRPAFHIPLGDIWPESLQEPGYVLQVDSLARVAVERRSDGSYAFPDGDITIHPLKPTLDVKLLSSGQLVLDEPIRYHLWNEEEEFTFYRTNGWKIPEERVKADGTPMFMICSTDIELSSPADTAYSLFDDSARLHYFKRGISGGFTLSLASEPFWKVLEPLESKKKTASASTTPIHALCIPHPCSWGEWAKIRLSAMPAGLKPRRLLIGEMRLQMSGNGATPAESERFVVSPGMMALPSKGTLIGLDGDELRRFPVSITCRFSGVAIETAAGWALPDNRRMLDKADLQTARILAAPADSLLNEWAYTEGDKFLARPSQYGDRIGQELVGLGAPLYFRKGPYNSIEAPIEISRSVLDSGVFGASEPVEQGWRIALRHELDLSDEFAVHAWYPEEPLPVLIQKSYWRHEPETRSLLVMPLPDYFDDPCSYSLSFTGISVGRTWCGMSALHDMAAIVSDAPAWKETAAWLAWWHVPVLAKEIRRAVTERIRSRAADTLVAWMGLAHGSTAPPSMTDSTLKMKDAIRTFFHNDLPESGKSVDVLLALELLSGDWDLDEDEAWERYENLLEISPVILVHLAITGTAALYDGHPDRVKGMLQLLRRRIAGLSETAPDSEIAVVERAYLTRASRVMGVDEQFINLSILEEARKLLKSERPPVRNLAYCLDIQPVRDWIALRLLA